MSEFQLKQRELLRKEWYVQAAEMTAFLGNPPIVATMRELRRRLGVGYEIGINFLARGYGYWFYWMHDIDRLARWVVAKEKTEPGCLQAWMQEWRQDESAFLEGCQRVEELELDSLSDAQLVAEFNSYNSVNVRMWGISMLVDAFGIYSEQLVSEALLPLLEEKGEGKQLARYLAVLTAPAFRSFAVEETESLLRIALEAEGSDAIKSALRLPPRRRKAELKKNPPFYRLLSAHSRRFFWIQNSYANTKFLDEDFFAQRVADLLGEKRDLKAELFRLESGGEKALAEKDKLLKQLDAGSSLTELLRIVEQFALWQDARKKDNLLGNHYLMLFLRDLSRRRGLDVKGWQALRCDEFGDALAGKIDATTIKERSLASLYIWSPEGFELSVGVSARRFFEALQKKEGVQGEELKGTCASPGRAQGNACVVLTDKDVEKIQKGNVLVSTMTRPELVPAMKKACAIVTDEGGITSHAAIISRELGIPCVIGTKIATKVFKDGDFVEVNANHGVVRRIQRVSK
ncbi:MAG: PEP-utilizing enzyme [Candidatus Micrarchaeota archaeon]